VANSDLYAILEVSRDCTQEELKKSYRRLARQYHPDTSPGDASAEAHFKEVSQAYEILSDPERRANYDRFGSDVGAGGNPFGGGSVQDIFDMFFGGLGGHQQQRRGPQPGPDAEISLNITFDDAAFGATHEVTVTLRSAARPATDRGARPGTSPVPCVECAGLGEVRRVRNSILGQMVTSMPCSRCNGMGSRIESPCPTVAARVDETRPRR
jgi:molecular chaperone DnaJ